MQHAARRLDPRYFQVIFQSIFLCYGITVLNWEPEWVHYLVSIGGCIFFQYTIDSIKTKKILGIKSFDKWGFSVLISAMSLCLLLKTNYWYTSLFAAFLSVASKYIFRWKGKHIFNPSAFGLVATLYFSEDAWLSPGQWGSNTVIFFGVITLGTIVVTRVQKLDISLAFLITYAGLLYWRQVLILGWPIDHFIHSLGTGSLLLFTFFMISDPRTSPNHSVSRIIWAVLIAIVSFYFAFFQWKYNTVIWALVILAPLVPLLDKIFLFKKFTWAEAKSPGLIPFFNTIKLIVMRTFSKKAAALLILAGMLSHEAGAFCGFYVSKADGTLTNKTSQVILVRDGNRNVITMYNDFKGNMKDFAMVVPVPVVLQRNDIKVVDQQIFTTLNDYSKPRLVEYYDQNPCQRFDYESNKNASGSLDEVVVVGYGTGRTSKKEERVKIEAKYLVGEYDILILSAQESTGLQSWLNENGYKMPAGAEEVLEPYIKSNLKFFVVKVNEKELKKMKGNFLRPIQISFKSPKFMLPIRLGMANSSGDQDMIVYAFTRRGRVETTNYRTVGIPTSKNIPRFVKDNFGGFYSNLFQHQWSREGKAVVMLEYAWDVSPKNYVKCDPCVATAPSAQDLVQAGVWWLNPAWNEDDDELGIPGNVHFTRLHVRYNRDKFPQDLQLQVTPNIESFQARYIITHPATGDFSCDAGKKYLQDLRQRRTKEMEILTSLTGKGYNDWDVVMAEDEKLLPAQASYSFIDAERPTTNGKNNNVLLAGIGLAGMLLVISLRRKKG
jgi:Na+-translocating ferredoxin:NAD+ oxidoreductase RnfD subunit